MVHFIVCDVKGRHDLIMPGGLSRTPMHVQTQAFLRLLQSSFHVNMALMCYLRLYSQLYIVVHVELVDFLRLW